MRLHSLDWKWPRNWNYVQLWCSCISSAFRSQKQTKHFDKGWKRTFLFLIRSTFASTIIVKLRRGTLVLNKQKSGRRIILSLLYFSSLDAGCRTDFIRWGKTFICAHLCFVNLQKWKPWCDFDKLSDPLDILIKIMLNGFPFIDQTWNWDITKPSRNISNRGSVKL